MDLSEPRLQTSSILLCNGCDGSHNKEVSTVLLSSSDNLMERNQIMKPTEDLISSELSKLSLQERSNALEDLHCVGIGLEESDEMVEQSLEEFDMILKQGNYPMYDLAAKQNSSYVEDTSYRLMFLRACLYDVHKAVNQLVNHLIQKAKYFGEDTLGRNITIDDLNEDDLAVLLSGTFHIQADKDPIDRSILCCMGHLLGRWNFETIVRAHYYMMFNILLPLEEVQTKGLVIVYYDSLKDEGQKLSIPSLPNMLKLREYRRTVPMRYSALHFCLKTQKRDNLSSNNMFLNGMLKTLSQYVKVRTRVHYGSDLEVQYSLRGYGIQLGSFPVDSDGNIRNEILNTWFLDHLEGIGKDFETLPLFMMEDETADLSLNHPHDSSFTHQQDEGIETMFAADADADPIPSAAAVGPTKAPIQPLLQDVLLGRGVRLMQHPGNIRFREFLKTYQNDYDNAKRNKRSKVSKDVVRVLQHQGVRFLERDGDGDWVESDASEAEKKVGQLFRSRRKMIKK